MALLFSFADSSYITDFYMALKADTAPNIRQISVLNFHAIFDLKHSQAEFEKSVDCMELIIYPDSLLKILLNGATIFIKWKISFGNLHGLYLFEGSWSRQDILTRRGV